MSQAKKIDTLTVKSVSTKISVSFLQTLFRVQNLCVRNTSYMASCMKCDDPVDFNDQLN